MEISKIDKKQLAQIKAFFAGRGSPSPAREIIDEDDIDGASHGATGDDLLAGSRRNLYKSPPEPKTKKRKVFGTPDTARIWNNIYGNEVITSKVTCKICQISKFEFSERTKWHIGHVIAFSREGPDEIENLRPICSKCNKSMGSKSIMDYCKEKYPDRYEEIMASLKLN